MQLEEVDLSKVDWAVIQQIGDFYMAAQWHRHETSPHALNVAAEARVAREFFDRLREEGQLADGVAVCIAGADRAPRWFAWFDARSDMWAAFDYFTTSAH